ncbi:hypothetical protein MKW92_002972 [Papaver armeniacum]|nr:hypothetical protein MKW92_002972 [Papaver armeniacum]
MGSGSFIALMIDVASGPLLSLVYPLFFTIQAVENGAAADHGPLLKYWSIYSGLALIEYFLEFIIDWLPWDLVMAVINVFLVIPHFNGAELVYQQVKAKLLETNPSSLLSDSPPFLNNLLKDQLGIMESLGKFLNSALQSITSVLGGSSSREPLSREPLIQSNEFRSMPARPNTHYQNPQSYDAPEDENSGSLRSRSYSMRNPTVNFDSNQDSHLDNGASRSQSMRYTSFNRESDSTNDNSQSNDGRTSGRLKTVPLRGGDYPDSKFAEPKAPKEREIKFRRWGKSKNRP